MIDNVLITKVENPRWHDSEHFSIICDVTVEGLGKMPFSVGHRTQSAYGRKLWQEFQDGVHGSIAAFIPPPALSIEEARVMMPTLARWRVHAAISLVPGLREKIGAAIEAMPEPEKTISQSKLDHVENYSRIDPLFDRIGGTPEIGFSPEDIDQLWETAAAFT